MTKKAFKKDMIIGLCVVLLAIAYLIITPYQVSMRNDGFGVSGRSLPHLIGLIGIVFGSWLALRNLILLRKHKAELSKNPQSKALTNGKRVLIYSLIMLIYFYAMQTLSFTISSMIVLYITMKYAGAKGQVIVIALSVLTPIVLYLLFSTLMSIPMPDSYFY